MSKAEERLVKLEEQRARINAEIQRVRARGQQQKRKDDTRRKVLIGSMVLAKIGEDQWWTDEQLTALMDHYLNRDNDRQMFGLEPRPKAEDGPETPSEATQAP